jgi:phenylpropionate dioxygenase-like ring-hydroxylating dioxygenase large terminal subunit
MRLPDVPGVPVGLPSCSTLAGMQHLLPFRCVQHGWQFEGTGAAAEIPQSEPGTPKTTACSSKRACAVAFPTAEAHGLLWVWLEAGPDAERRAAATPLPVLPAADQRGREWFAVSPW